MRIDHLERIEPLCLLRHQGKPDLAQRATDLPCLALGSRMRSKLNLQDTLRPALAASVKWRGYNPNGIAPEGLPSGE